MCFLGKYEYAMDERGRVPLPPRYRDAFRDGVVLNQGTPDRCLRAYTMTAFRERAAQHMSIPALHRKGTVLRRGFFPNAHEAELDKQNRILIPAPLREYARLSGKVLVIGNGETLEIWSPDGYETEEARLAAEMERAMEAVEERAG